jgi:hypothetical protein
MMMSQASHQQQMSQTSHQQQMSQTSRMRLTIPKTLTMSR